MGPVGSTPALASEPTVAEVTHMVFHMMYSSPSGRYTAKQNHPPISFQARSEANLICQARSEADPAPADAALSTSSASSVASCFKLLAAAGSSSLSSCRAARMAEKSQESWCRIRSVSACCCDSLSLLVRSLLLPAVLPVAASWSCLRDDGSNSSASCKQQQSSDRNISWDWLATSQQLGFCQL